MKSKQDFSSNEEYLSYLRTYFAGLLYPIAKSDIDSFAPTTLIGLYHLPDNFKFIDHSKRLYTKRAIEMADELLNQLNQQP